MEPGLPTPLYRITHSKVQRFLRCHRQFWFADVSGERWPEEEESGAVIVGNAVHRGMQELAESGDADVAKERVEAYLRMPKHAIVAPGTGHYDTVFECLDRGVEAHESIGALETWGELTTWAPWPSRRITVLARADRVDRRIDGTFQVTDWKTGRYDDPAAVDDQLDLAHLAVRVAMRVPPEAAVMAVSWNLRTGVRRERRLLRSDAQSTMKRALGLARRFQAETEFRASPGHHCTWCRWRLRCDAAQAVSSGHAVEELMEGVDSDELEFGDDGWEDSRP